MRSEEQEFLAGYDMTKYERPSVAADVVVFAILPDGERSSIRRIQRKKLKVLLIKRGGFPYKGCWAIPGGFCNKGEDVIDSARRELFEETGIENAYVNLVGVYGKPGRDPRGWIISSTYMALMNGENCDLKAGDDARDARWFTVDLRDISDEGSNADGTKFRESILNESDKGDRYRLTLSDSKAGIKLTALLRRTDMSACGLSSDSYDIEECDGLAFDHAKIITEAVLGLRKAVKLDPEVAFGLISDSFTLTELQKVYEQVLSRGLTAPNFRRKIADYVEETDGVREGEGFRPAKLFRHKKHEIV